MNAWLNWLREAAPAVIAEIVYAIVIIVIGILLARLGSKIVARLISRGKLKEEKMLISLAGRSTKAVVLFFSAMMALDKIDIFIAPFIASLGVGGGLGFCLSGYPFQLCGRVADFNLSSL